jgi:hypothetical protein
MLQAMIALLVLLSLVLPSAPRAGADVRTNPWPIATP